jgi:hypothetical protein
VPLCITSATDRFNPWRDSLHRACAVVLIGVSDMGVATMGNKKALFVRLMNCIPRFETNFSLSSIDSLYLRVAQVARSRDMCVHRETTDKLITLPLTAQSGYSIDHHHVYECMGMGLSINGAVFVHTEI